MKYKRIMNETSLVGSIQTAQHLHFNGRIYRKNDREKGKIKMLNINKTKFSKEESYGFPD